MSLPKKHKPIMKCLPTLCEDGLMMEPFNLLNPKEGIEDILLNENKQQHASIPVSKIRKIPVKKSYMLVFPPKNRNLISTIKYNSLKTNTLDIPLCLTLGAELISNAQNLTPFWTEFSTDVSKKLWSIPMIDCQDSDENLLKKCSNVSIPNSSLSIIQLKNPLMKNSQRICYQSLQFSLPDITDQENIKMVKDPKSIQIDSNDDMTKFSRKIGLYPDSDLKIYFNKCFGSYRYFYNSAVKYVNDKYYKKCQFIANRNKQFLCCHKDKKDGQVSYCDKRIYIEMKVKIFKKKKHKVEIVRHKFCKNHKNEKIKYINYDLTKLRNKLIPSVRDKNMDENLLWQKEIPYDLKQNAIRDLMSGIKSAMQNSKRTGIKFEMKYKSKKNTSQIFKIPNSFVDLKNNDILKMYNNSKNNKYLVSKRTRKWLESINYKINDTVTIQKIADRYYLYMTFDTNKIDLNRPYKCVSIDPGIRTFSTIYSPEGVEGHLGNNISDKIYKIGKIYDKLFSLRFKKHSDDNKKFLKNCRTRRNMKKKCHKLLQRMKNITDDYHKKIINFLCINFDSIIIPKFDVSKKIRKDKRKINSKVVKNMLYLSHGRFLEKLKLTANRLKNKIIVTTEEYTSKTCGKCGNVKQNLGSNKVYNCDICKFKIDRDINGARNILIRALTKINK